MGAKRFESMPTTLLSGVPVPWDAENRGFYFVGMPGSGKTQAILRMLYLLRKRDDYCRKRGAGVPDYYIIYDRKPDYIQTMMRPDDKIICPADQRRERHNLFREIANDAEIEDVCLSMVPERENDQNAYWTTGARDIIRACLTYVRNKMPNPSNGSLCHLLMNAGSPGKLYATLSEDRAAALYARHIEGADQSSSNVPGNMMSTVQTFVGPFLRAELAEDGEFSVKEWIRGIETGRTRPGEALFLLNPMRLETPYRPYMTLLIDLMLKELLSLSNDLRRRVWIFIDEFGTLMKLGTLVSLLKEGRSKGACPVLGIQDNAQGEVAYGKLIETIFSACGNKSIMRVTDANQAEFFSRTIAEMECVASSREMSMTYDDQGARVQLQSDDASRTPQTRRLVLPGQIQTLKDMEAFVQVNQRDWCRTRMHPHGWGEYEAASSFIPRQRRDFDPRRVVGMVDGRKG